MSKWHGAADLSDDLTPLDDLMPLPDNPRQGDIGAISQSLQRFGQLKPVVVDGAGIIVAGNHTYHAAAALGWTHLATTTPDHLDSQDLAAFALADNRLSDLADYDHDLLLVQLQDLDTLDGTGFDYDDVDDLIAFTEEDFHPPDGVGTTPTIAEREAARLAARETGNEVRTIVFILSGPQYAWAVAALDDRDAETHTAAFLDILADLTGESPPNGQDDPESVDN